MTKLWEVWKPWKPVENLYALYKTSQEGLDKVLQHHSFDKLSGRQVVGLYDANLLMIQDLALVNIEEQIDRPSERIKYATKDEVLRILSWPYHHSGQRIDQLKPYLVEAYSDFYDSCHRARSVITNQIWEDSKNRKTDPNTIPYNASLMGGLLSGLGAGYIDQSIVSGIVVGVGVSVIISSVELLRSRSRYKKKQISYFKKLTTEDRLNSLEALTIETLKILKEK